MFRSGISSLRSLAVAAMLLGASAVPAFAQHHGGGGWGGGWGGGGGWHGGGGWYGGWGGGYYHHGYGYPGYGGYYGYAYPYYGGYYGYAYPYYPYTNYYYQPYYSDNGVAMEGPYQQSTNQSTMPAQITVRVPPSATVWFDDFQTDLVGIRRSFQTPPLNTDKTYSYKVRARWSNDNGEPMEETRRVEVKGGAQAMVDFTQRSTVDDRDRDRGYELDRKGIRERDKDRDRNQDRKSSGDKDRNQDRDRDRR